MKKPAFFLINFLITTYFIFPASAQGLPSPSDNGTVKIMFYNVENYFDTVDNPSTNDEEFTPNGYKHWTFWRYRQKQLKIARVINTIGKWDFPVIVGMSEVENRQVLEALIKYTPLSTANYQIIQKESPDRRGIDVAMFYIKEKFQPIDTSFIFIKFPNDPDKRTRDILYVKGILNKIDTLNIFVDHWPSRYGGQKESEPNRTFVAHVLRKKVDSIFQKTPKAKIIIMGDFNDEPFNKSISQVLKASDKTTNVTDTILIDLMNFLDQGTYKYKFEWNMLDQFIISGNLFHAKTGYTCDTKSAGIFRPDWLMEEDKTYPGSKPFRTYLGPRYNGGYSDHLPVYLNLTLSKP